MVIPLIVGMALIHGPTCKPSQQALRFLALPKKLLSKSHASTNSGSHNKGSNAAMPVLRITAHRLLNSSSVRVVAHALSSHHKTNVQHDGQFVGSVMGLGEITRFKGGEGSQAFRGALSSRVA